MSNEMERLSEIYKNAYDEGIWIKEFGGAGHYMAAAGSIKQLEDIEKETGEEIDVSKLTLADIINISLPGSGSTREEACLAAIRAYKEEYQENNDKNVSLYGNFEERGYRIEAYIPNNDKVPQEFIVRAYRGDKLVEEMKVPMLYRPVFGVDIEDKARLEKKTEELMARLP